MATIMGGAATERTGKPREVQGQLNHFVYHPAARRLALVLAKTPVTPNAVSITGAAMVIAAGVLYTLVGGVIGIALGFALHLAWHVVDGADGDLARMTGRASASGEIVDGLCDYGGHVVLYLMLGASLSTIIGPWGWALMVVAGLSRIAQSIYAESQRRTYLWWAYGVPWLRTTGVGGARATRGGLAAFYIRASGILSGGTGTVDTLVAAAKHDPAERERIADLARQAGRRTLPGQIALGANPRTILLGLSMIAGSPVWFFLIEATILNLLLVASILQQRRTSRQLAAIITRGRY